MSRYVPSPEERAAIDLLTLAGYTVVRRRTYDALLERVRIAEVRAEAEREHRESGVAWAHSLFDEQRHLCDRLTAVATASAALGVPITAINDALATAREAAS